MAKKDTGITHKAIYISIRLQPEQRDRLEQLARLSGRSRGGVFKRLLELTDVPAVRESLGIKGAANES